MPVEQSIRRISRIRKQSQVQRMIQMILKAYEAYLQSMFDDS